MTLRQYLFLMSLGAILCWAIWLSVLFFIDPGGAGLLGFIFFYLSLFLAFVGTLSVLGLALRMRFGNSNEAIFRVVTVSFRQAAMLSLLFAGSLFLQGRGLLDWWNIIFLVLAIIILEFFFVSYSKKV